MSRRKPAVWVLSDRRYMRQRMPQALLESLSAHTSPRLVVADEPHSGELEARPGDLVVTRSRHPRALAMAAEAERHGARTLDAAVAVERVRDKARATATLARHGVPVPRTVLTHGPEDLAGLPAEAYPLVVKPVHGDNARGVRVVREPGSLAPGAWRRDALLAQRYVEAGGVDLKVYVAGQAVWAVRRPSPLAPATTQAAAAAVTPAVTELVSSVRSAFGLQLFGLDVLESPAGLAVVDVNEFPNYTGIPEAPEAMSRVVLEAARRAS